MTVSTTDTPAGCDGQFSPTAAMLSRRTLLGSTGALALAGPLLAYAPGPAPFKKVQPLPLHAVRLKPSIFADAVEANRKYLLALNPDRLLHNFRKGAGLTPKGELYGGWEARGIAGHILGHYLSACALMHAQTSDQAVLERLRYTIAELAACQAAHGDGYIGGTTVEREGKILDGKVVFEEVRRGDIRTSGFDINGGWVPLYTWHKVHAGLIDADRLGGVKEARPVMLGMADYLAEILDRLSDEQMQKLLAAEHGGLNESYADTYAITGNRRYLALAERIRHRAVLDPLAQGRDNLQGLHANTQIPKVIGLARIHELNGDPAQAEAARFFHRTVTGHHSYVIGGNSEREHFGPPGVLSSRITDRTCEACNSYNMMKLTRHIYGWDGQASHFDYYERAHLNHIMAHQHPETGMFVYFMPLSAGGRRTYSTPEDSFWCCVGSGIESHSKHGDSIYWSDGETLYVNLFIPSTLNWEERGIRVGLETQYPFSEEIILTIAHRGTAPVPIALRIPGWCETPSLRLNGAPIGFERRRGYLLVSRTWKAEDRLQLTLPMSLRAEPTPDDPRLAAFTHGPLVLAADLGPADAEWTGPTPAIVGASSIDALKPVNAAAHVFQMPAARPAPLTLRPFFNQYDRRTAVYFPLFNESQWEKEEAAFLAAERERQALEARTIDVLHLGEMQPERDHDFATNHSDLISFGGKRGRQAWWGTGNYLQFNMAVGDGPNILRALYWGEEVNKDFDVIVDGQVVARERRQGEPRTEFVGVDYPLPVALTRGKRRITVRFETRGSDAPVYEVRTLSADAASVTPTI